MRICATCVVVMMILMTHRPIFSMIMDWNSHGHRRVRLNDC